MPACLKTKPEHELAVSRSIQRTAHLAKARVLNAGIGFVEYMPVECVEKLSAELSLHPFCDREGLGDAQVLVVEGERAYVRRVARHIAKDIRNVNSRIRVRIRESATVPVARGAGSRSRVVPGRTGVVEQQRVECTRAADPLPRHTIRTNAIVEARNAIGAKEADRLPAQVAKHAADSPAPNDRVYRLRSARKETLAVANGQLINVARDKVVGNVLVAHRLFSSEVIGILGSTLALQSAVIRLNAVGVGNRLREGVGDQHIQPIVEAPFQLGHQRVVAGLPNVLQVAVLVDV